MMEMSSLGNIQSTYLQAKTKHLTPKLPDGREKRRKNRVPTQE